MGTVSVMVKPASSACNLRCRYCFYADVAESRAVASHGTMQAKTAELLARINAVVRRPAKIRDEVLEFSGLSYSMGEKTLNGEALTAKEASIVAELMRTPGKIVKKDYLLNKIWGGDAYGEDNYIEVYMSRVRKLLKKLGSKAKIVTVRGLGYKLVEG